MDSVGPSPLLLAPHLDEIERFAYPQAMCLRRQGTRSLRAPHEAPSQGIVIL